MAKFKPDFSYLPDGSLELNIWLDKIKAIYQLNEVSHLKQASEFALQFTHGMTTFYGQPYIEHGLNTAQLLLGLKLDQETAAAAILSSAITQFTPAIEEKIKKTFGPHIAKLVMGVKQTDLISTLSTNVTNRNHLQSDKLRKMLLTMAADIRVVIIKLAERLCLMIGIKHIPFGERKKYAQEVLDIYAPLANRLGIGQLKWELEDMAFHYLDPAGYKTIAKFLAEKRGDREERIQYLIQYLQEKLDQTDICATVTGRAKHIYSIYLKSQRKDFNYQDIYDYSAVRILVDHIEDCYKALSLVHSIWPPIMGEFDDYIANPKPNGYQSIHTAVIGEDNKYFEIQIRTYAMHEESEHGVAAHWVYKENNISIDDKTKITYLRQLLDWQKDITASEVKSETPSLLDDQVYVITPAGDIIDLPKGATPIDFAYHIHSELGHRCRGAKVNNQIVSLNYSLQTGDKVELIVIPKGNPSRDWLNLELGFIKTARARSKIYHWFKQQALNQDIQTGREILERELNRQHIGKSVSLAVIAKHFQFKNEDALFASLARGNIRPGQIIQFILPKINEAPPALPTLEINLHAQKRNYGTRK
jgi:GTP pyrophosphokinase